MSEKIISIEAKLKEVIDPLEKIKLLNDLSWELRLSDPHRGLEMAGQAIALSKELSYSKGLAEGFCCQGTNHYFLSEFNLSLTELEKSQQLYEGITDLEGQANTVNCIGNTYFRLGKYPEALQQYMKSLQLRKDLNNVRGEASTLNNIGNIYLDLGDYETCLDYYLKCLNIVEKENYKLGIAAALSNISLVYNYLGDYQNALDYQLKSSEMGQIIGNRQGVMISLYNIGDTYLEIKEYQKALENFNNSLKISQELGEHSLRANSLFGIGRVYQQLEMNDLALKYYLESLTMSQESGEKEILQSVLLALGKYYSQTGNYEESGKYLHQSLTLAHELKSKPKTSVSCKALSEYYYQAGDYQKALDYYQKYHDADKEVFNESSDKKRQASMIKFQVEQKEKEAEIYRLRNVELAEANQAITQAKEIIEEKNRHITSSIEYARRIQQAVLPPAGKMQAALPEHFVLFKPRDIVSGDFYWFSQTGGKTLIAVVDCTGHGVPGAFMSMIGSMLLNTIVNENGETDPANILAQLHIAVRSALKQHDAEADTTDGMDVSLCAIEQGAKRLVYAGAKRPLYLVRNNELTEIGGDGKSIGGRQKEEKRAFSDKRFELQDGDMLYLTSDGYADQCDPEGCKIGSRRLKELLIQVSGESHTGQRAALLSELEAHQSTEEQRDDIAIVGIRI